MVTKKTEKTFFLDDSDVIMYKCTMSVFSFCASTIMSTIDIIIYIPLKASNI
jgi:hypothetical protein